MFILNHIFVRTGITMSISQKVLHTFCFIKKVHIYFLQIQKYYRTKLLFRLNTLVKSKFYRNRFLDIQ